MQDQLIRNLENDVHRLKNIVWVAGALALIFGVSGGWGLSLLKGSKKEIKELELKVEEINIAILESADTLKKLREQEERNLIDFVSELRISLGEYTKGAIVAFEATNCPQGWTEYEKAYGRFIRGIDKSQTPIDPDGLRSPGSEQPDEFESHEHKLQVAYHQGGQSATWSLTHNGPTSIPEYSKMQPEGGSSETRPKNVALLYCQKS